MNGNKQNSHMNLTRQGFSELENSNHFLPVSFFWPLFFWIWERKTSFAQDTSVFPSVTVVKNPPISVINWQDKNFIFALLHSKEFFKMITDIVKPLRKWIIWRIWLRNIGTFENLWIVTTRGFLNWKGDLCLLAPWPVSQAEAQELRAA